MTAAAIQATFAEFRMVKTRSIMALVFEIPIERADEALRVLGGVPIPGEERHCGIARLQLPEADASTPNRKENHVALGGAPNMPPRDTAKSMAGKAAYAAKDDMEKAVTRSALLSKDTEFHRWCTDVHNIPVFDEDSASSYIRGFCGIISRNEIASNHDAFERFLRLETSYDVWLKGYDR